MTLIKNNSSILKKESVVSIYILFSLSAEWGQSFYLVIIFSGEPIILPDTEFCIYSTQVLLLGSTYPTFQLGSCCFPQAVCPNLGHQVLRIQAADEPLKHTILCQEGFIGPSWVEVNINNFKVRYRNVLQLKVWLLGGRRVPLNIQSVYNLPTCQMLLFYSPLMISKGKQNLSLLFTGN